MKRKIKFLVTVVAAMTFVILSSVPASAGQCTNTTWKKIMERGEIVVGVKADYKPWGFLSPDGKLIGMEPDMAQEVADAMGVKLKLVPTPGASRLPFLETGKIDMILATWSDTADRRKVAGLVLPNYYSSGTNVMAAKALGLKKWQDLRGKTVCGKQGAFYNEKVSREYGAHIISFLNRAEGLQALRDKKCIAILNDDSSIIADLASGDWPGYEMPLKTEDATPWALAVPLAERNCIYGRFMSGMIYNWLHDGRLIELEAKWKIKPPSEFLKQQKKLTKDFLSK
jgi:polar amino acid transport system substrate-binding protein